MPPFIIFIFVILWLIFSFKVALFCFLFFTIIFLWIVGKFMYDNNPRSPRYYKNKEK